MRQQEEPLEAADDERRKEQGEACWDAYASSRSYASEDPVSARSEMETDAPSIAAFEIDDGARSMGKVPKLPSSKKARRYQHQMDEGEGNNGEKPAAELEEAKPIPKAAAAPKLGWKAWAALIIFLFQTALAGCLVRYTKAFQVNPYSSQAAVLMQELVKLPVSMLLFALETGGAWQMVLGVVDDLRSHPMEWVKMTVPAFVYTAQMNFLYVGYENVPVAIGQITYQSKVLFTALCSVLMLKKQLSANQWISQGCLLIGVVCVQSLNFSSSDQVAGKEGQMPLVGTIAFLAAAASSAFASVYLEKMLKSDHKPSLWLRNIQLAVYGSIVAAINVAISQDPLIESDGLCYGMDGLVWFCIFWQAGGGLLVALTIKYADNILKCFAQAGAIIVVATISHFTVGFSITPAFAAGAVMVVTSIFLYGEQTKTPCELFEANYPRTRQALNADAALLQDARKKYTRIACGSILCAAAVSVILICVPPASLLVGAPPSFMPPAAPSSAPPGNEMQANMGDLAAPKTLQAPLPLLPPLPPPPSPAPPRPACEYVLAEYNQVEAVQKVVTEFAAPHGCDVWVYSKSGSCPTITALNLQGVTCTPLNNVGLEQHTFVHHVSAHWDTLADRIYLVPVPLFQTGSPGGNDHRYLLLQEMNAAVQAGTAPGFMCNCLDPGLTYRAPCPQQRTADVADFSIRYYHGHDLTIPDPSPLRAWAAAHTDREVDHVTEVCYKGVAGTTRSLVHAHARSMYADLEEQLGAGVFPEAAHYMERLMAHVFG